MTQETIGARIQRLRISAKLSRVTLSGMVNVSSECIRKAESDINGINFYTAIDIANALNVSVDYLARGYERV
jgi:transcriptional regulator with XRE-family HTH domain